MLGKDLNELIKNAEGIMEKAKEKLSTFTAHGEAGAGLVKVKVNAKHQVIELKLDDEILKEAKEVIEELICAAMNDANNKITKATQENVMSMSDLFQNKTKDE